MAYIDVDQVIQEQMEQQVRLMAATMPLDKILQLIEILQEEAQSRMSAGEKPTYIPKQSKYLEAGHPDNPYPSSKVIEYIKQGKKIHAIKQLRNEGDVIGHYWGLKEAKEKVEEWMELDLTNKHGQVAGFSKQKKPKEKQETSRAKNLEI